MKSIKTVLETGVESDAAFCFGKTVKKPNCTQIVGLVCPLGNNLGEANGVPQSNVGDTNVTAPPSSISMLPVPSRIALPPLHLFTDSTKSTTTLSSDPSYSTSSSTNTTPTKSPLRYHSSTQFSTPPSSTLHYTNTHQTPPTSNSSNRTRLYQSNVRRSDSFSPGEDLFLLYSVGAEAIKYWGGSGGKISLICLEGKSMTPHRVNTILFCSSQLLSRLRLGPSKGFLS